MPGQLTTQEETISKSKEAIICEAKRIEENCLYTSKGHFIAAQYWTRFHLIIGIPTVILAAIAGAIIFSNSDQLKIVTGILSIIILILTAVTTFLNPKETANSHLTAGNNYDSLLTSARIFWSVECKNEESERVLTEKLIDLSNRRDKLNKESPQVSCLAYRRAKRGIEKGESAYSLPEKRAGDY